MCRILKTSNQNTICHNHLNMKRIYRKQATNNACSDWLRKRISRGCEIDWVRIDSLLTPLNDSSILEYRLGVDDYLNNRHALNWKEKDRCKTRELESGVSTSHSTSTLIQFIKWHNQNAIHSSIPWKVYSKSKLSRCHELSRFSQNHYNTVGYHA